MQDARRGASACGAARPGTIAVHDIQGFCCSFNRQIEQLSAVPDDRKQIRSGLKEILSELNQIKLAEDTLKKEESANISAGPLLRSGSIINKIDTKL